MDTNLVVGDHVVVDDCHSGAIWEKLSGSGYKVTSVREKFIECTNPQMTGINRTKYYGPNDLHLVRKV